MKTSNAKMLTYKTPGQYGVKLMQNEDGTYRIIYGAEQHMHLTYHDACRVLGECLMHAAHCVNGFDHA